MQICICSINVVTYFGQAERKASGVSSVSKRTKENSFYFVCTHKCCYMQAAIISNTLFSITF